MYIYIYIIYLYTYTYYHALHTIHVAWLEDCGSGAWLLIRWTPGSAGPMIMIIHIIIYDHYNYYDSDLYGNYELL